MMTATYSPDDNKLRLYSVARLDAETYARVKAAGFKWAPQQQLFVAPMWTPERADLLIELCGEIDDEDTSLAERADERAERFSEYREKRGEEADRAHAAVSAIADGIPLGQPILVGHHSERRARKDAERIENGMRRALKLWETAQYWKSRAAGALRHAKYKERPDVRARRIKGLESDQRKFTKSRDAALANIRVWGRLGAPGKDGRPCDADLRQARALHWANYSGGYGLWSRLEKGEITPRQAQLEALRTFARIVAHARRWLQHLGFRLEYERAMLAEAGGLITDRAEHPIQTGGRVLVGNEWCIVLRINRKDGRIVSLTTTRRYVGIVGIERVQDYRPPTPEDAAAVDARATLPPLCNYPGPDFLHMTAAEFKSHSRHSDFWRVTVIKGTEQYDTHRQRIGIGNGYADRKYIYLTDAKRKDPPPPRTEPLPPLTREIVEPPVRLPVVSDEDATNQRPGYEAGERARIEQLREQVKAGVQVVSAPNLFPTPKEIARRLAELAEIRPGMRVLEPSAGTGQLLEALTQLEAFCCPGLQIVAVEINPHLVTQIQIRYPHVEVHCADFLSVEHTPEHGRFDRIVMNPPFERGIDIAHIQHARRMLSPGGRLVAICANGPRQQAAFEAIAESYEPLPADTFDGTSVRAAIVVLPADAVEERRTDGDVAVRA